MDRLLILATLIVTTTTIYGLVVLWAATSARRWFVRTSVVFVALGLPLLIPAYELTVTYAVQALTVALGIQIYRRFLAWRSKVPHDDSSTGRSSNPAPARFRFSLASLLWMTVFVALAAAVVVRLPFYGWQSWQVEIGTGAFAGIQTLTAAWVVYGKWRPWIRVAAGIAIVVVTSAIFASAEATFAPLFHYLDVLHGVDDLWPAVVPPSTTILMVCFLAMFQAIRVPRAINSSMAVASVQCGRCGLATGLTVATLLPPSVVFIWLLNPTPIPEVSLPEPNGYHDLVAAGKELSTSVLDNWDTSAVPKLRAEVLQHQQAFDRLALGLTRECRKPQAYVFDIGGDSLSMDEIQSFRAASNALSGKGHIAKLDGRYEDALNDYLTIVRFGAEVERGGLLVDSLVGLAIRDTGMTRLEELHSHLSTEQCHQAILVLRQVRSSLEPPEDFIRRDRIWSQHVFGWGGHLYVILDTLCGEPGWAIEALPNAHQRNHTQMHLLIAELAIRAYQLQQGTIPVSLAALVPDYLPEVPTDPCGDGPLMYRLTDNGYLLYSVGPNGDDDDGQLPEDEEYYYIWSDDRPGDVTLEMFADDEADENATTLDDNETRADDNKSTSPQPAEEASRHSPGDA